MFEGYALFLNDKQITKAYKDPGDIPVQVSYGPPHILLWPNGVRDSFELDQEGYQVKPVVEKFNV